MDIEGFRTHDYLSIMNNGMAAYFGIDICQIKPN
jgi:hypothetical protein